MDASQSLLSGSKEEVSGAIAAFEEILGAMPNDRVALQTLYEGYSILENKEKANHYLARLAHTIAEEQDADEASTLLPHLQQHQGESEELNSALQALEELMGVATSAGTPSPAPSPSPASSKKVMTIEEMDAADLIDQAGSTSSQSNTHDAPALKSTARDISAELSLAWNILQAKVIDEEEYSSMVHDLSELANRSLDVPVSVLHVLQDRNSSSLERVLQFIVKDTNTPYVQLSRFEYGEIQVPTQLPESYLNTRGAVVFESLDNDSMIAILNPYDQKLIDDVKKYLKSPCHFFITKGDEYDFAVQKILRPDVDLEAEAEKNKAASEERNKKSSLRLKKIT